MKWYKESLRKNILKVDLHAHAGERTEFKSDNDFDNNIHSMLSSAIAKGLDIIGIISHTGSSSGFRAKEIVNNNNLDIFVIPGQEYVSADKTRLLIYNIAQTIPNGYTCDEVIRFAHNNNGFVMGITLTKQQTNNFNKKKGTLEAPDAIEIYNASIGGYKDIKVEYPTFISSAAKNPSQMDSINVYTLVSRDVLESIGLIPEGQGIGYIPNYLQEKQPSPSN